MTTLDRIVAARALLAEVTPLKGDCGRRCGAACCQADDDGQGGMLLLPGEEGLYAPAPGWARVEDSGLRAGERALALLTCDGTCPRGDRPLACRIFPLTPRLAEDGQMVVTLDVRAWPVCPLMPHGMQGLSREFVAAVRAACVLLAQDEALRAWLHTLTQQLRAFETF